MSIRRLRSPLGGVRAGQVTIRVNTDRKAEAIVVVDREQGPLAVQAFELFATGEQTLNSLHMEMTTRGLRNKCGRPLSRSKLAEMLHNKFYIGILVHDGVEYPGAHEALISRQLFDRVQQVFAVHHRGRARLTRHPHFLRGILFCSSCGSQLSSLVAKQRYGYFYCLGRFTRRTNCKEPYLPIEQAERLVEELYEQLGTTPSVERALRLALKAELAEELSSRTENMKLARRRLARAEHERDKLVQAYLADALALPVLKREQQRVATEIALAQAEMQRMEENDTPHEELLEFALSLARDARTSYAAAEPHLKALWNQAILDRVELARGDVMSYRLRPPFDLIFAWAGSNKGCLVGRPGHFSNSVLGPADRRPGRV